MAVSVSAAFIDVIWKKTLAIYIQRKAVLCGGGKIVRKKWKHLLNNSQKELKKMNGSQCGDPDVSRNKMESVWR